MPKKLDLTGQKFGKLTVISECPHIRDRVSWLCRCDCGQQAEVTAIQLKSGMTKSCGCLGNWKHRMSRSPEYDAYYQMIGRCGGKSEKKDSIYGKKGIRVCERWKNSFENFFQDMGPRPSDRYSLDRIDHTGNYAPENCRWATKKQQSENRCVSHKITFMGETLCLSQWSQKTGIDITTIGNRLRTGWSVEKALTTIPRKRNSRK